MREMKIQPVKERDIYGPEGLADVLEQFTGQAAQLLRDGSLEEYARVLRDILHLLDILGVAYDEEFEAHTADALRLANLR